MAYTILSLFSGIGGLDLGIQLAWPGARVLGYVERDAYAAAVLLARMEDSSLEPAPVWIGDIQDVDGSELRGRVDIICGGFPCQDISVAGKGVGIGGERSGLWSEIVRLADEIRPRYLFLENVSAITSRGLDAVLADLAALGFDAEWLCLRASDVGAPHRRERWFCLAYRAGCGKGKPWLETWTDLPLEPGGFGGDVADAAHDHRGSGEREAEAGALQDRERWRRPAISERAVDDPNDEGLQGWVANRQRADQWAVRETGCALFPPGPADHDAWRRVLEHSPHLAPAVEPGVRVSINGVAVVVDESRADQLRCCGNAVVPLQAAVAFRELMRRVVVVERIGVA